MKHKLAGKFLKYKEENSDRSWDAGRIYKVAEDGTTNFSGYYTHRCAATTLEAYLSRFEEVTEEEYNKQEGISYIPLIFN